MMKQDIINTGEKHGERMPKVNKAKSIKKGMWASSGSVAYRLANPRLTKAHKTKGTTNALEVSRKYK
jgi:hypothetical protein